MNTQRVLCVCPLYTAQILHYTAQWHCCHIRIAFVRYNRPLQPYPSAHMCFFGSSLLPHYIFGLIYGFFNFSPIYNRRPMVVLICGSRLCGIRRYCVCAVCMCQWCQNDVWPLRYKFIYIWVENEKLENIEFNNLFMRILC